MFKVLGHLFIVIRGFLHAMTLMYMFNSSVCGFVPHFTMLYKI